jgi:hypothetical protein
MTLIERLDARAKQLDREVRQSPGYNQQAADDRDLLEAAKADLILYRKLVDRAMELNRKIKEELRNAG